MCVCVCLCSHKAREFPQCVGGPAEVQAGPDRWVPECLIYWPTADETLQTLINSMSVAKIQDSNDDS